MYVNSSHLSGLSKHFGIMVLLFCLLRDEAELHKVFHGGAGWSHRSSFYGRGGGVRRCGAGAAKGYQSKFHEGAGKRGGNGSLAGGPRDEFCLQRLHLQDHVLQEGTASCTRSVWYIYLSFSVLTRLGFCRNAVVLCFLLLSTCEIFHFCGLAQIITCCRWINGLSPG